MDSITGDMIKKKAKELGADIVGIALVDRFEDEAEGYRPAELLPGAKSVISVGIRQLRSYLEKAPNTMCFRHYFMQSG
jgi:epoxyqueuosine reductase QueG